MVFKMAGKETQIETQKAVMKLLLKLHSVRQTSKQNKLQLSFALMQLTTFPAKFTNSVDSMGAFALQNQILIFNVIAEIQVWWALTYT